MLSRSVNSAVADELPQAQQSTDGVLVADHAVREESARMAVGARLALSQIDRSVFKIDCLNAGEARWFLGSRLEHIVICSELGVLRRKLIAVDDDTPARRLQAALEREPGKAGPLVEEV